MRFPCISAVAALHAMCCLTGRPAAWQVDQVNKYSLTGLYNTAANRVRTQHAAARNIRSVTLCVRQPYG